MYVFGANDTVTDLKGPDQRESYGFTTNQKCHGACDPTPAVNVPIQFVCAVHWKTVNVNKRVPPGIPSIGEPMGHKFRGAGVGKVMVDGPVTLAWGNDGAFGSDVLYCTVTVWPPGGVTPQSVSIPCACTPCGVAESIAPLSNPKDPGPTATTRTPAVLPDVPEVPAAGGGW